MSPLPGSDRPTLRAAVSVGLLSGWLVLLMAGFAWGGAVHLLLVASLVAFPWRALRLPVRAPEEGEPGARRASDARSRPGPEEPTDHPSHPEETPP